MGKKTLREELEEIMDYVADFYFKMGKRYPERSMGGCGSAYIKQVLNRCSQFADEVIGKKERLNPPRIIRGGHVFMTKEQFIRNQLRKEQRKRKEELLKEENGKQTK